jgi:8-oxo-dGTP pyrophosphatase MutT (NUDIX family)
MLIRTIADFATEDVEAGVGLALQGDDGRYLFFLAGTRHHCAPGELFYAGIGGHREMGEDWLTCAQREAREEIGINVTIMDALTTYYISRYHVVQQVDVDDRPRPLALYEMIHLPDSKRAGEIYRLVIYRAWLSGIPRNLPLDELRGVIALMPNQVLRGPERRPTIAELLDEGAAIIAGKENIDENVHVYPIGTAFALAYILRFTL